MKQNEDCLLLMVESTKMSTCNIHDGKAAASQMHISGVSAPKNQGYFYELVSG